MVHIISSQRAEVVIPHKFFEDLIAVLPKCHPGAECLELISGAKELCYAVKLESAWLSVVITFNFLIA